MPKKAKIYFAGPLFTQAEWQWNARLADEIRSRGLEVILPQITAEPMLKGKRPFDAHALFATNIDGIEQSTLVLAILDQADPDSGTCWECGYAYKLGRPIIGLRTDIRRLGDDPNASVNLMLSQCCKKFIQVPLNKIDDFSWVGQQIIEGVHGLP